MAKQAIDPAALRGARYLIVSTDDHAGPRPSQHLRDYCPPHLLEEFDALTRVQDADAQARDAEIHEARDRITAGTATVRDLSLDLLGKCRECEGHFDSDVRLADMDADGVAAQIIFAGGQNDTELPWVGFGWNAGPKENDDRRRASYRMWNEWIADYCAAAPHRLNGVAQIPIWNIEKAVEEVRFCAERGVRILNFHAPRDDYPAYTSLDYEPFWLVCEEVGATLVTHAGASAPYARDTRAENLLYMSEFHWYGNRGLTQLIFGGVFERYPSINFVLTEQRVDFAPMMVKHLDSLYDNSRLQHKPVDELPAGGIIYPGWPTKPDPNNPDPLDELARPSTYWNNNCYLSGSFLAPFEAALRHEVGLGNLMWGADYPHCEGTWPDTDVSLRHTFADIPEDEARLILGENAVGVYGLDRAALRTVADRIGPLPEDLARAVTPEEIPVGRSWAFRREANFT